MKLEISLVLLNQKLRCLTKRTYLTDKARMWKRIGGGQIKNSNNSGFKEIIQRKNVRISDFKSEHTSVTGTRADEEVKLNGLGQCLFLQSYHFRTKFSETIILVDD
ncbi:uncharacterized protein [Primulina huaijiensis]|uniref:uncharacterized protein isoform X2 n=1 Tax=Primulina huaijiensis TaxID=1492673 RepID=UPI003CC72542